MAQSTKRSTTGTTGTDLRSALLHRDGLAGLLVVIVAFTILTLLVPGGSVGGLWRYFLDQVFGWGAYLAPIVASVFAAALIRERFDRAYRLSARETAGWLITFVAILALLQMVGDPLGRDAGGLLGRALYSGLVLGIGSFGAGIVIVLLGCVGLVLVLELSPSRLLLGLRSALSLLIDWVRRSRSPNYGREPAGALNRSYELSAAVKQPDRLSDELAPASVPLQTDPATGAGSDEDAADDRRPPPHPTDGWLLPDLSLLQSAAVGELSQGEINQKVRLIEQSLADFDVHVRVVEVNPGPTVTQFGLEPGFRERRDRRGTVVKRDKIKISEITSLANDLALALAAPSLRIEAPVPGRQVVGVEVPNSTTTLVTLKQVVETTGFQRLKGRSKLALVLGEDVSGRPVVADLAKMPHLLIAGQTGSGKSVCINSIITCLLLNATPDELRMVLVDPKRVELNSYNNVPHLLRPVVVEPDKVVSVLKWTVREMEERYKLFERLGVRNIEAYNRLTQKRAEFDPLYYIVLIVDELADLMMLAADDIERLLCRLAQLARATGIHLIIATQRPSVDVITGLIKANFPTRISFAVASQVDSRTILDGTGAEKLLGRGDMLYMPQDAAKPIRLQGVFVSDDEIEAIVGAWKLQGRPRYIEKLVQAESYSPGSLDEEDEYYDRAVELAGSVDRVSVSLLQRRLRVGYNRAARLLDMLQANGVIDSPGAEPSARSPQVDDAPPSFRATDGRGAGGDAEQAGDQE